MPQENPNTSTLWNSMYSGRFQKKSMRVFSIDRMESILPVLEIPATFCGTIVDFGCGAGDGTAVLAGAFPDAKVVGTDYSETAIEICRQHGAPNLEFRCRDIDGLPDCDILIAMHVIEHIADDVDVIGKLLEKAKTVFIAVPYREDLPYGSDVHLRRYDEYTYRDLKGFRRCHVLFNFPLGKFGKRLYRFWWWPAREILKYLVTSLLGRPRYTPYHNLHVVYEFGNRGFAAVNE